MSERKYSKVSVGGTFDYLHDGHKSILSKAFEIGDQVLVGVVSDKMELKKDSAGIQPLGARMADVKDFLRKRDWIDRADFVILHDPFGPAVKDENLEALVVSEETQQKAEEINEIRRENGLNEIDIISIPLVFADDGKPISSIRIRYGEIDEQGNVKKEGEEISDSG